MTDATTTTRRRIGIAAAVVVAVLVCVLLGALLAVPASSTAPWTRSVDGLAGAPLGGPGEADGALPGGVTAFDDRYPAIANLDPALLSALRDAATDASREGVTMYVNSGWRSPRYQEALLQDAIVEYGSAEEAARWVATPETSSHVSGAAADIGGMDATTWLAVHGAGYGLCQIYSNEPWHFELRADAIDGGCPAPYVDPSFDPRMRR